MDTRHSSICVLVSGGLDSAALVHRLLSTGRRLLPVYVRCGLRWEAAELYWLRRFLAAVRSPQVAPLVIVDIPVRSLYGSHWSLTGRCVPSSRSPDAAVYLPGRNVLLLSAAAIACAQRGISTIALGTLRSNPFADATPLFFKRLSTCLTQALEHSIRIITPLRRLKKAQVIRSASQLPFHLTFSCLQPRGHQSCGRCNKCAERAKALQC